LEKNSANLHRSPRPPKKRRHNKTLFLVTFLGAGKSTTGISRDAGFEHFWLFKKKTRNNFWATCRLYYFKKNTAK